LFPRSALSCYNRRHLQQEDFAAAVDIKALFTPFPTRDAIHTLVDRFRANLDSYKRGTFGNETQVRREFIDPMFEALGWDVAKHDRPQHRRCR
jgi:hypothetical protein